MLVARRLRTACGGRASPAAAAASVGLLQLLLLVLFSCCCFSLCAAVAAAQDPMALWQEQAFLKAEDVNAFDWYGKEVSVSGKWLAVGARQESSCATGVSSSQATDTGCQLAGAVLMYERNASTGDYTFFAYLKASNTDAEDEFGSEISLDGDRLAVGSRKEDSCATGAGGDEANNACADAGAVFIFEFDTTVPGQWAQTAYLKADNTDAGDWFGATVSLDGGRLAVGAFNEDSCASGLPLNNSCEEAGAVYIFELAGMVWTQTAYIKASNPAGSDFFARGLGLDGDRLAVGASLEDGCAPNQTVGCSGTGAAYVFEFNGTGWTETAYLKASNAGENDAFGRRLWLDGTRLAVAAFYEDSCSADNQTDNTCTRSGAVYIFELDGGSASWFQSAYLKSSNPDAQDWFGDTVRLDGDRLAVGALHESSCARGVNGSQFNNSCNEAGAVYLFRFQGGMWSQVSYLKASNAGTEGFFSSALAFGPDFLVVGASHEKSCNLADPFGAGCDRSGAVYVFGPPPTVTTGTTGTTGVVTTGTTGTTGVVTTGTGTTGAPTTAAASSTTAAGVDPTTGFAPPSPPPPPGSTDDGEDAGGGGASSGGDLVLILILAGAGVCVVILVVGAAGFFWGRRSSGAAEDDSSAAGSASAVEMAPNHNNSPASGASSSQYTPMRSSGSKHGGGGDASSSSSPSRSESEYFTPDVTPDVAKHDTEYYTAFVASAEARDLTDDVVIATQIGKGNFGRVFRGDYDGRGVAIKQIMADAEEDAKDEFAQELGIMLKLNSARIIKLFGVCQLPEKEGGGMGLVMELAAKGSLDRHLQSEGDVLGEAALLQISLHIAEGLAALHRASVVHRDLAARNVLVTYDGMCKLADFGLSRSLGEGETYTATSALPVRWTAPETLNNGKVTQASDLYSLAMTMIEVFDCGRLPFDGMAGNMEIMAAVAQGKRPAQPAQCPSAVFELMQKLWAQEPKDRGTARTAATELRELHAAAESATPDDTYQSVFAATEGVYDAYAK